MDLPETGLIFHPEQYVHGLWLVPCHPATPLEDQYDWLCCLWRELDQPFWFVRYRFRYVRDLDPWSGRDQRSWSTLTRPASTPVETIALDVDQLAQVIALRIGTLVQFTLVAGDGDTALRLLAQQPWLSLKEVPYDRAP